jgi:hypothetical protein
LIYGVDRRNRYIGVVTGGHERGLKLTILAGADGADAEAREKYRSQP